MTVFMKDLKILIVLQIQSTIASLLEEQLVTGHGKAVYRLDGDNIRTGLNRYGIIEIPNTFLLAVFFVEIQDSRRRIELRVCDVWEYVDMF